MHRGAVSWLAAMGAHCALPVGTTSLSATPVGFDICLAELMLPWAWGGQLVLASGAVRQDGRGLAVLIRDYRVAVLSAVSSLLELVMAGAEADDCASMRLVLTGGEVLKPSVLAWAAREGIALANCYGPAEATISVTWYRCAGRRLGGERADRAPVGQY